SRVYIVQPSDHWVHRFNLKTRISSHESKKIIKPPPSESEVHLSLYLAVSVLCRSNSVRLSSISPNSDDWKKMSERNRQRRPLSPRSKDDHRRSRDRHSLSSAAAAASDRRHTSIILEDRIAIQHREIQALIIENERLAAAHVALKQDLALAQQDVRLLAKAAGEVKAERDGEVRDVFERSLKIEAELRSKDSTTAELAQVRSDLPKLAAERMELVKELEAVGDELMKTKRDSERVSEVKAEIQKLREEIQKGRAAVDYEKKTRADNLEHGKTMDKCKVALADEIERLEVELAKAQKRARLAAAGTATMNPDPAYASRGIEFGTGPYPNPYALTQAQGIPETTPVSRSKSNSPYELQQQEQAHT
ncbi:Protein FLC EXPRESSOR, partial [Linum grandiflorum]